MSATDYAGVCSMFHTLFVQNIPVMTAARVDHARRFITLVDTAYDRHIKLVCTAAAPPDALFDFGDANVPRSDPERQLLDDLRLGEVDHGLF